MRGWREGEVVEKKGIVEVVKDNFFLGFREIFFFFFMGRIVLVGCSFGLGFYYIGFWIVIVFIFMY